MKTILLLSLLAASVSFAKPELPTVDHVDLTRYQGTWFEIAAIPQSFQRKCVSNTTAEYSLISGNEVRVLNSCEKENGERTGSEGRARIADEVTNSKLDVTFFQIAGKYFYFFGGKYWIIYLEPNYQYAIVGHPDRTYGWILSRNPSLSDGIMTELKAHLVSNGYDLCRFMTTPQDGGIQNKKSLCE